MTWVPSPVTCPSASLPNRLPGRPGLGAAMGHSGVTFHREPQAVKVQLQSNAQVPPLRSRAARADQTEAARCPKQLLRQPSSKQTAPQSGKLHSVAGEA